MNRPLIILLCATTTLGPLACAGTFEEGRLLGIKERAPKVAGSSSAKVRDEAYCRSKDDQAATWNAVAVTGGALGGASGLSTVPMTDRTTRIILGISAIVAAGVGVGAAVIGRSASAAWARECSGP